MKESRLGLTVPRLTSRKAEKVLDSSCFDLRSLKKQSIARLSIDLGPFQRRGTREDRVGELCIDARCFFSDASATIQSRSLRNRRRRHALNRALSRARATVDATVAKLEPRYIESESHVG